MPTISATMGVQANRLCMGEASRGDIGCPTYAPNVTTAGDVSITGNVSAAKFLGDGSGLTGVVASSGDRITSGTTLMLVDGATGFVSLTQNATNTGWFDPTRGLVTLGVSATGSVSATNLYSSGPISGNTGYFTSRLTTLNSISANSGNITAATGSFFVGGSSQGMKWGSASNAILGDAVSKYIGFTTSGTEAMRIVSSGYVGIGTSAPAGLLDISGTTGKTYFDGTNIYFTRNSTNYIRAIGATGETAFTTGGNNVRMVIKSNGQVGIGGSFVPTTALEVSGTISATNFVGNGSGLTGLASGDRLVSGSVSAIAEQTSGTVRVSGTLALTNTGNESCNASKHYSLRINPATGILQMCRP